jgi:hypothetical protein
MAFLPSPIQIYKQIELAVPEKSIFIHAMRISSLPDVKGFAASTRESSSCSRVGA